MNTTAHKTILVTGASSGFGAQIAHALARQGHRVFGTSRKPSAASIGDGSTGTVRMLALDVTDPESVRQCLRELRDEAGRLDVLINNAGSGLTGAVEDCDDDEVRWQMETNLFGTLRMIREAIPLMREQGAGRIITIGSMAGHASLPYQGIYSASKHGLEAINEALRLELRGSGIDSTIICPGDFQTGFTDARVWASGAHSKHHHEQIRTTVSIYEKDERNGADPDAVACLVQRLVAARAVKVRYFVGRLDQRLGMYLKRLLPARWFEALLASIYKV